METKRLKSDTKKRDVIVNAIRHYLESLSRVIGPSSRNRESDQEPEASIFSHVHTNSKRARGASTASSLAIKHQNRTKKLIYKYLKPRRIC